MRNLFSKIYRFSKTLSWKLTLNYIVVTISSITVVGLLLGVLFFRSILIPSSWLTPQKWLEIAHQSAVPIMRNILSQSPIDNELLAIWLNEIDLRITSPQLLRFGGVEFSVDTLIDMDVFVIDPDGTLLGALNPENFPKSAVGKPFDIGIISGLNLPLQRSLKESITQEQFTAYLENESFIVTVPVLSSESGSVLGVIIGVVEYFPTQDDNLSLVGNMLAKSFLFLLIIAGSVGAIFGFFTSRGMSRRFKRLSAQADAWSKGDFTKYIVDPSEDEISYLTQRLNRMAKQLESLLKKRQKMAIAEERNRLARDLHDSAKQQTLAASFQLGTAITLFNRDPETAKRHVYEADTLVNSVRKELTNLIFELRPPSMDERNFHEILNEYAVEWAHQNDIAIEVNLENGKELNFEIKQTFFRIMQEALANIARHSKAHSVRLSLIYDKNSVTLAISDDGIGFCTNVKQEGLGLGLGLDSMQERTESLNGKFILRSEPGQGTSISIILPLY
jgi:signal transduction histidine kinase